MEICVWFYFLLYLLLQWEIFTGAHVYWCNTTLIQQGEQQHIYCTSSVSLSLCSPNQHWLPNLCFNGVGKYFYLHLINLLFIFITSITDQSMHYVTWWVVLNWPNKLFFKLNYLGYLLYFCSSLVHEFTLINTQISKQTAH